MYDEDYMYDEEPVYGGEYMDGEEYMYAIYTDETGRCPYCGSEDIEEMCDGTCRCMACGQMFR